MNLLLSTHSRKCYRVVLPSICPCIGLIFYHRLVQVRINQLSSQQEALDRDSWRSSVRKASGKLGAERHKAAKNRPRVAMRVSRSLPITLIPRFRLSTVQWGLRIKNWTLQPPTGVQEMTPAFLKSSSGEESTIVIILYIFGRILWGKLRMESCSVSWNTQKCDHSVPIRSLDYISSTFLKVIISHQHSR